MTRRRRPILSPAERHQRRIALATLRMPDALAAVMGGPTKAEARDILRRLGVSARDIARAEGPTVSPDRPGGGRA